MPRIRTFAFLAVLLGLLLMAGTAVAAPVTPAAWLARADYVSGDVYIGVRHVAGTERIAVKQGGLEVVSTPCAAFAEKTLLPAYRLTAAVDLVVEGRDGMGRPLWEVPLRLDPAPLRPKAPTLATSSGTIVGGAWHVVGTAVVPVTSVRVVQRETGESWDRALPAVGRSFEVTRVPVWRGPATFDVTVRNAFGSSSSRQVRVYNLGGSLPRDYRYVLVDKSVLWLYDVAGGRVRHAWPVAIGTPQTPTPTGYFKVYGAVPGGGDWGVIRRPLRRLSGGHTYATRYYIHGTNAPWSIGMMASHGCIRMHNRHVLQFARYVPNGTVVRIR